MSVDMDTLSLFLNQRRDTLKCFHLSIKSILNYQNLKKQDFIALFGNKNLDKLEELQLNTRQAGGHKRCRRSEKFSDSPSRNSRCAQSAGGEGGASCESE